jgi:hypothetical protein
MSTPDEATIVSLYKHQSSRQLQANAERAPSYPTSLQGIWAIVWPLKFSPDNTAYDPKPHIQDTNMDTP